MASFLFCSNKKMVGGKKMKVKKGCVAVQVGLANQDQDQNQNQNQDYYFRRFVIPISYLYNPLFQTLLEKSSEIYDYQITGPLMLPCSPDNFLHLIQNM